MDPGEARGYKQQVLDYTRENPSFTGFPANDPQVLEIYWSKGQVAARQHPHVFATLLALNNIWTVSPQAEDADEVDLSTVLTYGERLRIRKPNDTSFQLGPHMDGGVRKSKCDFCSLGEPCLN